MNDTKLPTPEDIELASEIKDFLLNNPYKKVKKRIWGYYAAWVYNSEVHNSKEHYEMLFLYERLKDLLKRCNKIYKKQKRGS